MPGSLYGSGGADRLYGDAGNDRLAGGAGRDDLTGGAGADRFVFQTATETHSSKGIDEILDFRHGTDKIDLSAIDAKTGGTDNAFAFIGSSAFDGHKGQLRYANGHLLGDVNGDKIADLTLDLTNHATLTVSDFIL